MTNMNTHGHKTEVICSREPFWRQVRFWIKKTSWTPDQTIIAFASLPTLTVRTPENEGQEMPPTFQMADEQAQQFMDELWRVGFRPSEGSGSAGSLAATQAHLNDMRALVFKESLPLKNA